MTLAFGSVCSGIEAASVAWLHLGWRAAFLAEIEPFPSAVLAHHYPDTPNLGDMTAFKDWPDAAIDVFCGGTPCQSFSNAGLRAGLDDPRGQLMLTFGAIAARYRPRWLVWENVPGVLSSNGGRDFGAFLGLLGFLGYGFAYRVLDAQFVRVDGYGRAVPQRRQRVFVVGCLGDWRSAAAVLSERESLRGDPAPRRVSGARVAATLTRGDESSGKGGYAGRRQEDDSNIVAGSLAGNGPGAGWRIGPDEAAGNQIVSIQGNLIGRDKGGPVGVGVGVGCEMFTLTKTDVHGVAICPPAVSPALKARDYKGPSSDGDGDGAPIIAHTLRGEGFDASEPAVAFNARQDPINGPINGPIDTDGASAGVMVGAAVRRLMPVECERLQGFPDNYTAIKYRGKPAADGPRYKALGNSWAVNCPRWIGRRICLVESIQVATRAAA